MKSVKFDGREIYPSKIVCVGRNYAGHISELANHIPEEPVIFIKPNSAIADRVCFHPRDLVHYEGEISFVIIAGKIAGVGFGLDLTKRDVQDKLKSKGLPWERGKAFDGSAVFSELVKLNGNITDLRLEFFINGKLVQTGSWELMLNKPENLLAEISTFLTIEDGDLLMTGTPKGVGPVKAGDSYIGKIFQKNKLLIEASWLVAG